MLLRNAFFLILLILMASSSVVVARNSRADVPPVSPDFEQAFVQILAKDKVARSKLADLGVSIEALRSDSIWGFVSPSVLARVKAAHFKVTSHTPAHLLDFPAQDGRFHNYQETLAALRDLNAKHPDITRLQSIGKSNEGRDLWAFHLNTTPEALSSGLSGKPGAIFMGNHHAREHLSVEVPLMLAEYLLANRADPKIAALLESRDIWVIPMVNPDGAEWDIASGSYRSWRKNRRDNGNGVFGVDLNRNYGFKWGTGGSSADPTSDVFKGKTPFSEPETQVVRDFVEAHLNAKVLLTFHSYSELILYPWGHKYNPVENTRDHDVFTKMATTMAKWNGYTPEQSSALYIASGDTTDWAYGAHGIFAFTFELSPADAWGGGGFYPGAKVIDKVFQDNLNPCLYMLDVADDPYRVLGNQPTGGLRSYVEPWVDPAVRW